MRVLVTGGAGFIGSNYVRWPLAWTVAWYRSNRWWWDPLTS